MKRNYLKMAFVSLFAVAALCSCNKDEDDNNDNGGTGAIQNNAISIEVEDGASYSEKIDIVKLECEGGTLANAPFNNGRFTLNLPASVSVQYLEPHILKPKTEKHIRSDSITVI